MNATGFRQVLRKIVAPIFEIAFPRHRTPPSRRLIIHAGQHKTASTTIQVGLFRNSTVLAKEGIYYPRPPHGPSHHYLVSEWTTSLSATWSPPMSYDACWSEINSIAGDQPATVILSSEEFSRKTPAPIPVDFPSIIQRTPNFDSREIVVVVRDQVSFLESIFMQIRGNNPMRNFSGWLKKLSGTGYEPSGLYTDMLEMDGKLTAAFGKNNVTYISYGSLRHHEHGPLGCLLDHMGHGGLPVNKPKSHNITVEPLAYYCASCIGRKAGCLAANDQPTAQQISRTKQTLFELYPAKTKTSLYTKAEHIAVRDHFEPINSRFKQVVGSRLSGTLDLPSLSMSTLYLCDLTQDDREAIRESIV